MDLLAVSPAELAAAFVAATTIAALAWHRRLLALGGALAASLLGPGLVAVGGWWLGVLLITFFLTSSLLPPTDSHGPARTARQVLANGGPALIFGILATLTDEPAFLIGAASTIAAATSDTWATELGKTYDSAPISIRTGRRVPPGTSGAISGAGTAASAVGALLIASLALLLAPLIAPGDLSFHPGHAAMVAASGLLGSTTDTLLGATLQARFQCDECGKRAETPDDHRPGHRMRHAGGIQWITNSTVNLVATTLAGTAGTLLSLLSS